MRQYVPVNWPVDGTEHSWQTSKINSYAAQQNSRMQTSNSPIIAGCFKVRQLTYVKQKLWV